MREKARERKGGRKAIEQLINLLQNNFLKFVLNFSLFLDVCFNITFKLTEHIFVKALMFSDYFFQIPNSICFLRSVLVGLVQIKNVC